GPSRPPVRGDLPAGGLLGIVLADALEASLNPAGAVIVLAAAFFVSLFLSTTFSFAWAAGILKSRFHFVPALLESWAERKAEKLREKALKEAQPKREKSPKSQTIFTEKETSSPSARAGRDSTAVTPGEGSAPILKPKSAKSPAPRPEFPLPPCSPSPPHPFPLTRTNLGDRPSWSESKLR